MFVNTNCHETEHIGRNAHLTLHFCNRSWFSINIEKCVVCFTVFLNLVSNWFNAPIFILEDFTITFF